MTYLTTQYDKNIIEKSNAQLHLWIKELNLENIELTYVGEIDYNSEKGIVLEDCLKNKFAVIFHGILNNEFTNNFINNNSESFKRIEYKQKIYKETALCFLIQDQTQETTIGAIKYIPIDEDKTLLNVKEVEPSLNEIKLKLTAPIKSFNENFSKVEFYLTSKNISEEHNSDIFGNLIVFQDKFNLLIGGRKKCSNLNSLLKLDLGELSIPFQEFKQLNEGNILELTEIENLTAKIMTGNQVMADGCFSYESGKIQLKIFSLQKEKTLSSMDMKLLNRNFVKRFFNDYSFEKEKFN